MAFRKAAIWSLSWLVAEGGTLHTVVEARSSPITTGEKLNVKLSGWVIGGAINIKGDATDDIAFSFELNQQGDTKYISRSSTYQGTQSLPEVFGGWPLGPVSRPFEMDVTLTASKWEVTLDGKRTPWFDFKLAQGQIANFPGYEVVNLVESEQSTVSPRTCNIECAEEECLCGGGRCFVKLDSKFCTVGGSDGDCCEGFPSTYTLSSINEGDDAVLVGDHAFLDRACASADVHNTCQDFKKQQDAGTVVQVISKERDFSSSLTGRVSVFLSEANAVLMASPWMLIPAESSDRDEQTATMTGNPHITIDQGTAQVVFVDYPSLGRIDNVPTPQKFISRLSQDGRNYQFTMNRLTDMANSGRQYIIMYGNSPKLVTDTACVSTPNWIDSQTNPKSCARYGGEGGEPWCTKFGVRTKAFRISVCGGQDCTFSAFARNGVSALDACCECGGGEIP